MSRIMPTTSTDYIDNNNVSKDSLLWVEVCFLSLSCLMFFSMSPNRHSQAYIRYLFIGGVEINYLGATLLID